MKDEHKHQWKAIQTVGDVTHLVCRDPKCRQTGTENRSRVRIPQLGAHEVRIRRFRRGHGPIRRS